MHYRTELRARIRNAVEATGRLAGLTWRDVLGQEPSIEQMPEIGIMAQRERMNPDAAGELRRRVEILIMIRRTGEDAADCLDDDSIAAEAAILAVLNSVTNNAAGIEAAEFQYDRAGTTPLGQVALTFWADFYTAEGSET